ncbi:MAG: hypothetical protein WAU86_19095 [Oricola sp.]
MIRAWLAFCLLAALAGAAAADMLTYQNDRFGTRAAFPAEIFDRIDPPPANGDGRRFRSADGAELAVYGQYNVLELTPAMLLEQERADAASRNREITYAKAGKDWAVVSGFEGDMIFYERREFGRDGVIHALDLRYPRAQKAVFDDLVGPIAGSLEGP